MRSHARCLCCTALCLATMCLTGGTAAHAAGTWGAVARQKQVARTLPEQPEGLGRAIDDRDAWTKLGRLRSFQSAVEKAAKLVKTPLPDQPDSLYLDFSKTGNRTRWQRVAGKRRGRVTPLALAECVENKGRFTPALEQTIAALCKERTWVMPAHDRSLRNFHGKMIDIDLGSSSLAWNLATADWLLGSKLSPATRRLIRDNLRKRILDPYRDMAMGKRKINWWMKTTNNWNAVCLAGVTGTALAQAASRDERAFFVVAAETYSKNFLKGFTPDGYCSEGLGYWNYGFGHYVLLAETVRQATGGKVDLMARPNVKAPARFGADIEIIGNVYPAFADCSVRARPSSRLMGFVSRRYGLGLARWEQSLTPTTSGGLFSAMLYTFPNAASQASPAAKASTGPGPRSWFKDAGVLVCRPGEQAKCRLGVAMKGGHNAEHHNHNDVGSYTVVVDSQAVLLDPGGEVYTARTFSSKRYVSKVLNSYGHPVPLVDGQLQQKGRQAAGRIVRSRFTDASDTLTLDLRSAYKVAGLGKLERTFTYSRKGAGSLTVADVVAFSRPKRFETAIVTFGRWKKQEDGSLLVYDTEQGVIVTIEATAPFNVKAEEIKEDVSAKRLPTRLGIELAKPVRTATVTVRIEPASLAAFGSDGGRLPNGGFELEGWGWRLADRGISTITTDKAANGKRSLHIKDTSKTAGSSVTSARIPVAGSVALEWRGKAWVASGSGVGMYVRFLDKDGKTLNKMSRPGWLSPIGLLGKAAPAWKPFVLPFKTPAGTTHIQLWIHSMSAARAEAYLDDMAVVTPE